MKAGEGKSLGVVVERELSQRIQTIMTGEAVITVGLPVQSHKRGVGRLVAISAGSLGKCQICLADVTTIAFQGVTIIIPACVAPG